MSNSTTVKATEKWAIRHCGNLVKSKHGTVLLKTREEAQSWVQRSGLNDNIEIQLIKSKSPYNNIISTNSYKRPASGAQIPAPKPAYNPKRVEDTCHAKKQRIRQNRPIKGYTVILLDIDKLKTSVKTVFAKNIRDAADNAEAKYNMSAVQVIDMQIPPKRITVLA